MINRALSGEIKRLAELYKVIAVVGPRQSGKTTLCKNLFPGYSYYNLDLTSTVEEIANSPEIFLEKFAKKGIIIDEVQKYPELFSHIKVIADEHPEHRFVITGSSNFLLLSKITESLAGRVAINTLLPLSLAELKKNASSDTNMILFNGGYPDVWANSLPSQDFAKNYYNTYIERDLRQIVNIRNLSNFQKFIRLCAGRVGTEFNASSLSGEVGVSVLTIQEWLSILEASFVVFRLPPFFRNIGKRLVKSPKIYFCDTAILCFLLGIEKAEQLSTHPLRGEIFENFVILEFLKKRYNEGKPSNLFFYRDKSQREIDIVQEFAHQCKAYEIKSAQTFNRDFFNNLHYLKQLLGDSLISTQVIYDGKSELKVEENGLLNFRNLFSC
jgi:predicted AAA+ superfamily ATPase